jgi:hypothetical protein
MSLLQAFHSPGRPQPPTASSRPVSQGFPPIGSEPAVPEASRLPPPRLNAHSMNLLNAFKGSNGSKQSGNNQARPSGQSGPSFNGKRPQRKVKLLLLLTHMPLTSHYRSLRMNHAFRLTLQQGRTTSMLAASSNRRCWISLGNLPSLHLNRSSR